MKIIDLVKANYGTYENTSNGMQERHWPRLTALFLVAFLLPAFSSDTSAAYPMMVTGITILTGFTFTALFSDHVLADVGLPEPSDESDRLDLVRLGTLSQNFKHRSSYFIALSIIDAVFLIAVSLKFSMPKFVSHIPASLANFIYDNFGLEVTWLIDLVPELLSDALFVIVTFIFLECLYTFYRLSETIITIVDIRRGYLQAKRERH